MATSRIARVEGIKRLRATLKKAGDDLTSLKEANSEVGQIVIRRAKVEVPRRSGLLASSMRTSNAKTYAAVRAGSAAVPYAGPIHWGWPARNIAAQPFLVDAAHDTESVWLEVFLEAIDEALAQVQGE